MTTSYVCAACGGRHDQLPRSYGFDAPYDFYSAPRAERAAGTLLSSDQCIVDGKWHFVKGNIQIPIVGEGDYFSWTVWVSLSKTSFDRMTALWNTSGRESEPPYFGWLCTKIPGYPSTLNIPTNVVTQPVGNRPHIDLHSTNHPLAIEQRDGMSFSRLHEIAVVMGAVTAP